MFYLCQRTYWEKIDILGKKIKIFVFIKFLKCYNTRLKVKRANSGGNFKQDQYKKIMQEYDSLLLCDKILICKEDEFVLESNRAVGLQQGRISYLGGPSSSLKAKQTYHLKNHLVCPGFVNTHTHLPMSLFRGLADNLSLKVWLEDYIFPLEEGLVKEDFVRAGTKLSLVELIRSGITSCYDMYFYNKAIAEVLDESGLRGIVGLGVPSVEKDWMEWRKKTLDIKNLFKDHPRVHIGIAPHAPYTVEPKTLLEIGEFSKSENLPLVIHVSESVWEQEEIKKRYNKTPVQHLHSLGVTGKNSLFVHCVHVNEKDLEIMSKTQTSLSYNPESNMKLSNGIAPVGQALEKGVVVGLGTDGSASNNNLNFFEEMGTGAKLQALKYGDECLTAQQIFKMASLEGARAMGLEKEIGSIEVGKRADIIALDLNHASFHPFYNPISNIVYTALGNEVSFVMCEGRVLMENYKLKTLDKQKVFKESEFFAGKIKDFLKSTKRSFD